MRLGRLALLSSLIAVSALPAFAANTHARRGSSSRIASKKVAVKAKPLGQRGIDPERATAIQAALIKSGYLSGSPAGTWNAETEAAMQKMQGDNGWQTKLVPDSRAIIKLGLGPAADSSLAAGTANGDGPLTR